MILESLFPNVFDDPTSKGLLTDSRTALLASEGMASSLEWDLVSLGSLIMEDDPSGGEMETEGTEMDSLSSSLSAIPDHSTLGLNATATFLGSKSTTGMEGDAVFQESWLYTLADDIAVEIAVKTILII